MRNNRQRNIKRKNNMGFGIFMKKKNCKILSFAKPVKKAMKIADKQIKKGY